MPIRPPALDDRSFNDLVEELIARIPAHTPEWRNPRPGDPGRTMIELFAWLADTLLYRVNLVPERQRLAFLRLLGMPLRAAVPARGMVTLSFDDKNARVTQVVQPRATVKGPVGFETLAETTVLPVAGEVYCKRRLRDDERASIQGLLPGLVQLYGLTAPPEPYATTPVFPNGVPDPAGFEVMDTADHALWIALLAPKEIVADVRQAIGSQALSVGVTPSIEVPALFEDVGPRGAVPHAWHVTTGSTAADVPALLALDVVLDSTGGLRQPGIVRVVLPRAELLGTPASDVRLNVGAGVGDAEPPRLDDPDKAAQVVTWLRMRPTIPMQSLGLSFAGVNAVQVEQRQTTTLRIVGQSDGTPNQEFPLAAAHVDRASFALEVEETGLGFVPWQAVDDFADVAADARAYVLDAEAGTVRFGDGLSGRVPEAQRRVRVALMRAGGGTAGNLPPGALTDVTGLDATGKPIAQKLKVAQTQATAGGDDAETLAAAERRIPSLFRDRDRAVTETDYRRLAAETPGVRLGRVEVLARFKPQQRRPDVPGVVSVMALPFKTPVGPPNPRADRPTLEAVYGYLAERRPVATELYVIGCEYVPLSLSIGVTLLDGASRETVLAQVGDACRLFLWPLAGGGMDGAGWRLGRSVRDRELDVIVARVPGVDSINGVNLFTKVGDRWQLVPRTAAGGPAEVPLESWQLPELEHVLVVTDADPPASLDVADGDGANAIAIPVVPKVC